jgi:hypothetical protein
MKKIIGLSIIVLIISFTAAVYARNLPTITNANKLEYKNMLKDYLNPVLHGYGIGFNQDNYITAKWYITNIKLLNRTEIKDVIQKAKSENVTDWNTMLVRIKSELDTNGMIAKKGRIRIDGKDYLLTNIQVSDANATSDIREIPDWNACKQHNVSEDNCETNSTKVGDMSLTKRTKPNQEISDEPKVWAGTLNFNNTAYTFVTLVYPR